VPVLLLWGNKDWESSGMEFYNTQRVQSITPKSVIVEQLRELSENYGNIFEFWLDMQCWADTTLTPQEIYDVLKRRNPKNYCSL